MFYTQHADETLQMWIQKKNEMKSMITTKETNLPQTRLEIYKEQNTNSERERRAREREKKKGRKSEREWQRRLVVDAYKRWFWYTILHNCKLCFTCYPVTAKWI